MTAKIFIDGAAGTTGLEIHERLGGRGDLRVVTLDDASRKDAGARRDALNDAEVVILCLPDDAAREAVAMIDNPNVRVIDASTAHRVAQGWTYGFAEMDAGQAARIFAAKRVSNPGCYPTGFVALVRPLVAAGIVPADFPLTVNAVSGYSGGGKAMIEEFEKKNSPHYVETVMRAYALTLAHKHVAEMQVHGSLAHPPVFAPSVGRYYRGMIVEVPLQLWALPGKPVVADLQRTLEAAYDKAQLVKVSSAAESAAMKTVDAELLKGRNDMRLFVFGNDQTQQARLVAVLDNLGKGAGGAAVQNLNLMLGLPETQGLLMYRPRAFVVDDVAVLHDFIRERAFATVATAIEGEIHFAYAPVVLDGEGFGRIRFHLAKANPVCASADGAKVQFSFLGDDTYISPDWYESQGRVPTWNYMAVEAGGVARKLSDSGLRQLLVDLSADQEARLLPKPPWQIGKVQEDRLGALLGAIDGFEVTLTKLEGKFKLSQNMTAADIEGAIAGLEGRADARNLAIARAMKAQR